MRIEQLSRHMSDQLQTDLVDFRYEKDLDHLSPSIMLADYYMYQGSIGLKTLPKYESLPGSVSQFYETASVTRFRDAINKNTAAIVLGNIVITLDKMVRIGVLDWEHFKKQHNELVQGTCMEGKISLTGVSSISGRVKPDVASLRQKVIEDPTFTTLINSYYHLPYELEMLMQRNYLILFDTGKAEPQRPIGSHVQEMMRDSFQPLANDIRERGLQLPLPVRFLDFFEGESIRKDVVAFLAEDEN